MITPILSAVVSVGLNLPFNGIFVAMLCVQAIIGIQLSAVRRGAGSKLSSYEMAGIIIASVIAAMAIVYFVNRSVTI